MFGLDEFDDGAKFLKPRLVPRGGEKKGQEFEQKLARCAPGTARSIKTLAGTIELWIPTKDPASIITASFASHIHRIQQIADAAVSSGRTVAV